MKKAIVLLFLLMAPLALFAKDKGEIITIQVLSTDSWNKNIPVHHRGAEATSDTKCNTDGTVDNSSVNATTTCTTTTTPGTQSYTTNVTIEQETVHAVLPDGRQITLWCQKAWRACMNLPEGSYRAHVEGSSVLQVFVPQLNDKEKKIKYRVEAVAPQAK